MEMEEHQLPGNNFQAKCGYHFIAQRGSKIFCYILVYTDVPVYTHTDRAPPQMIMQQKNTHRMKKVAHMQYLPQMPLFQKLIHCMYIRTKNCKKNHVKVIAFLPLSKCRYPQNIPINQLDFCTVWHTVH